jgi:hypothetical protein
LPPHHAVRHQHGGNAGTVFPDHRQDGTGLDDDFKQLAALVVELEQFPARIRWPVEEMGRNSVSPSTMPRMAALSKSRVSMM